MRATLDEWWAHPECSDLPIQISQGMFRNDPNTCTTSVSGSADPAPSSHIMSSCPGRVQEGKKGHPKWTTTQKIIFLKMCPRPSTDSPWLMLLWPDHDLRSFGVCGVVKAFMFLFLSAYFWEGKNLTFLCFELEQIRGHFSKQVPPWRLGKVVSDFLYLKV